MANKKDIFGFLGGDVTTKIFATILIIVIIALLIWQGKRITTWFKNYKKVTQEKDELSALKAGGVQVSYSQSQFNTFADKLHQAMKGPGTNTTNVYAVFNAMNNKADVLELIKAFGVRDKDNLVEYMSKEWLLSIPNINKILATKGIDYQF